MNQQSLIYEFGPHYSAPQLLNKDLLNYIELHNLITKGIQGNTDHFLRLSGADVKILQNRNNDFFCC